MSSPKSREEEPLLPPPYRPNPAYAPAGSGKSGKPPAFVPAAPPPFSTSSAPPPPPPPAPRYEAYASYAPTPERATRARHCRRWAGLALIFSATLLWAIHTYPRGGNSRQPGSPGSPGSPGVPEQGALPSDWVTHVCSSGIATTWSFDIDDIDAGGFVDVRTVGRVYVGVNELARGADAKSDRGPPAWQGGVITATPHLEHDREDVGRATLAATRVCDAIRADGQRGLGIIPPRTHNEGVWWNVSVELPWAAWTDDVGSAGTGQEVLPPLDLQCAVGPITIAGKHTGIGHISAGTGVGDVNLDDVRGDVVDVRVDVGKVRGTVGVGKSLHVETRTGDINIEASVLRPRAQHLSALPPVTIDVSANVGDVTLRHGTWESSAKGSVRSDKGKDKKGKKGTTRRQLDETVRAKVGKIEVVPHAAFEGTFKASNNVGAVTIDLSDLKSAADPDGKGRTRHAEVTSSTPLSTEGKVWWGDEEGEGSLSAEAGVGRVKIQF